MPDVTEVGKPLILTIDGQPVTGEVVAVDLVPGGRYANVRVQLPVETPLVAAPVVERRRYYRLALKLPVVVIVDASAEVPARVRATGHSINLSGGGMVVALDAPLLPGIYHFRIALPDGPLDTCGQILRGGESAQSVPVEFAGLNELGRSRLIRFIFGKMRTMHTATDVSEVTEGQASSRAYWRQRKQPQKPTKFRYW